MYRGLLTPSVVIRRSHSFPPLPGFSALYRSIGSVQLSESSCLGVADLGHVTFRSPKRKCNMGAWNGSHQRGYHSGL